jgi:hypothetical protein
MNNQVLGFMILGGKFWLEAFDLEGLTAALTVDRLSLFSCVF